MSVIRSRDNARVKRWAKLVRDGEFRKAQGRMLLEGPHLLASALERGLIPASIIATERGLADLEIAALVASANCAPIILEGNIFKAMVDAETPQGVAAEFDIPALPDSDRGATIFLESIQDAGNVGTIVRSAAAFGAGSVVLDRACADPWSPKALRAGMGGHFGVSIRQVPDLQTELDRFEGRLLCTVVRGGLNLRVVDLSGKIGWLFGSEGRGVSPRLRDRAEAQVTIEASPAAESLNVAAAAAICLYESFSRPGAGS